MKNVIKKIAKLFGVVFGSIISFFAGGHAGLVLDEYTDVEGAANPDYTLESTGFGEDTDAKIFNKNYWYEDYVCPFNEVITLRVKTTKHQQSKVISKAMALVGEPYNYSFIFNTKEKSYCTDIIGKCYEEIGIDLNKDKLSGALKSFYKEVDDFKLDEDVDTSTDTFKYKNAVVQGTNNRINKIITSSIEKDD